MGVSQPLHRSPIYSSYCAAWAMLPILKAYTTYACSGKVSNINWVESAIVKKFGSRVRRLTTDIGDKGSSKLTYDINERELRLITAMTEDLHLILLECPNISSPADVAQLNMAPIMFLFRISNRKVNICTHSE
ncbi:unnamed protein product [Strongylus vulgaris]|uniref:Uncharacterized protein n=1 Tax=Strongylus vulgaris TaxID=40348 RepID=A0A3P7LFH5_STRVU|nr:unnamed protein product [Strongylus vulgaris]